MKNRLYISGMDPKGDEIAREFGLGFEVTKFSWAEMFDDDSAYKTVSKQIENIDRLWFHAPFAELFPCAIDKRARSLAVFRYRQSMETALSFGIKRMVVHAGYVPTIYFPEWFVEQSVLFWKEFLNEVPEDFTIAIENVMEPGPDMLCEIVKSVDDKRLGICLDIGHAHSYISNTPAIEWVEPMSNWLVHTHIHDNLGERDVHMPLGEGNLDLVPVIDKILATKATITIENQYVDNSIKWLKDKGYI